MLVKCTCSNEYQDKTHGKGMRVHNEGTKDYKCTSCGKANKTKK